MYKKFLALVLAGLVAHAATAAMAPVASASQGGGATTAQPVETVKAKVARQGVGENARVTVRMKNGTKVKGYVSQIGDEDFVVRDRKTDAATTVAYNDVAKVESNRGHSTARNVGIGVAVGVGAVLITIAALIASLDD